MNYKTHKVPSIFSICLILFLITSCSSRSKLMTFEDIISTQVSAIPEHKIKKNDVILLISEKTASQKIVTSPTSVTGNAYMWQVPIGKYLSKTSQQYFSRIQGTKTEIISVLPDKILKNKVILEIQVVKFNFGLDRLNKIDIPIAPEAEINLKVIEYKNNFRSEGNIYKSGKVNMGAIPFYGNDNDIKNKIRQSSVLAIITALEQVEKDL